jgi:acetyltransferase-like isoleucine patch superfamily enzyme
MKYFAILLIGLAKLIRFFLQFILKSQFKKVGKRVKFDPFGSYSFETIEIGNDVFIGKGAILMASDSFIKIGNKVMFGPNVTIMGGDHNVNVIGKYMFDVKEKAPNDDLPVIIEDDVWIGASAIILKGVTISKGSIVAAGALVKTSFPPYSIVAGVPAKVIRSRFDNENLKTHEKLLNVDAKT